jgi:ATP-dependent DNA ligase
VITDYSGAGSRLPVEKGLALSRQRWAWQPKMDGVYVQARTDRTGRIIAMHYRSGLEVQSQDAADLLGLAIAAPLAILHGELEAQTEASLRARATRGKPLLHVFDCSRLAGEVISSRPFSERYAALHRWQAAAECYDGKGDEWHLEGSYARDVESGRYIRPARRNLARVPIVQLHRGPAEELWRSFVEVGGGEGIVACRLDAPLGARSAKRKIKASDEIECVVIGSDRSAAELDFRGHRFLVSAQGRWSNITPGTVVSVRHDGWYERRVEPRFARIVRVRADL